MEEKPILIAKLNDLEKRIPCSTLRFDAIRVDGGKLGDSRVYGWVIEIERVRNQINDLNQIQGEYDLFETRLSEREKQVCELVFLRRNRPSEAAILFNVSSTRVVELIKSVIGQFEKME
jgi:DNA-directed RNA polymerase specialized sigma subunit